LWCIVDCLGFGVGGLGVRIWGLGVLSEDFGSGLPVEDFGVGLATQRYSDATCGRRGCRGPSGGSRSGGAEKGHRKSPKTATSSAAPSVPLRFQKCAVVPRRARI